MTSPSGERFFIKKVEVQGNTVLQDEIAALTQLYEKREEHSMALDAMEKLSEVVEESAEKVALFFRMGTLLDKELGDRVSALDHFQRAVDLDGRHLPALEAMRSIHLDEGDFNAAARVLTQITEVEDNPRNNRMRAI